MIDWTPVRAKREKRLAAFTPRIGRHDANCRNTDYGPGVHKAASALSRYVRLRLVLEADFAEDVLRLRPRGTNNPVTFITPAELSAAIQGAGLVRGAMTGVGPRAINRQFDLTFGPLPLTAVPCMGVARKPLGPRAIA